MLLDLVLDGRDTFVTLETARTLLRRGDIVGLEIVARARATADDNRLGYIAQAADDVLGLYATDLRTASRICADLAGHDDEKVRQGAASLCTDLDRIRPVLSLPGNSD